MQFKAVAAIRIQIRIRWLMISKIISGGQTGADQGALDAAIKVGIPHGGWIPKGRLTEKGPLSDTYQLKEMETDSYSARTEKNILDSDGTLILSHGTLTGGSKLTQESAEKHHKPHLHIDLSNAISRFSAALTISNWIKDKGIKVLNVAGARASKDPMIYQATMDVIETLFIFDQNLSFFDLVGSSSVNRRQALNKSMNPKNIDEAVEKLISGLPLKDKATIANMPQEELYSFHNTLGQYIRNNFGLWDEDSELMKSCRKNEGSIMLDPNEATSIIIKELWDRLRKTHKLRLIK